MKDKSLNRVTLYQRNNGVWCCCGTPHVLLELMGAGGIPVSPKVKTYYKGLAKLGVKRGWFSYQFTPDESLKPRLLELLQNKNEISGFISDLFNDGPKGHA